MNDTTLRDIQTMYDHFANLAQETDEEGSLIWRGKATETYRDIEGFNVNNYNRHRRLLVHSGCILIQKQGARFAESRWLLIARPTQNLLDASDSAILKEKKQKRKEEEAILLNEVKRLQRQLGGLDVVDVLREMEERLTALELQAGIHREETPI